MPSEPRPAKVPAAHSTEGTSEPDCAAVEAQLSSSPGVESVVSSIAMDRGLLAMATGAQQAPFETDTTLPDGGQSDADIMLQVKAGDD